MKYPTVHNKLLRFYLYAYDICCYMLSRLWKKQIKKNVIIKDGSKLLLSNIAAIGDTLYTLRCATLIKKQYPGVKIGLICSMSSSALVRKCSDIDEIYIVDHWGMNRRNISIIKKIFHWIVTRQSTLKRIKKDNYQYAIDCYYYYPSMSLLFFQAKIPYRIGYDSNGGSDLLTHKIHWQCLDIHNVEYQANLLKVIGIDITKLPQTICNFGFEYTDQELFSRYNINPSQSIVVAIGVGAEVRELNYDKWCKILTHLSKKDIPIILTGHGNREANLIKKLEKYVHSDNIISLCDRINYLELIQIVKKAKLFIGLESSTGHIAAMYKINQLSLMHGSTNLYQWQPYSNPNCMVIRANIKCSPCYSPRYCKYNNKCMDLSIERILVSIDKALKTKKI